METPEERERRLREEADAQARSRAARKLARLQKKVGKAQEAEAQTQPPRPAVIKQPVVKPAKGFLDQLRDTIEKIPIRVEIEGVNDESRESDD
jgi:hypothetical protein